MHTPAIPVNVVGVMEFPAPALSTVATTEMIAFQKLRATATNVAELVVRNVWELVAVKYAKKYKVLAALRVLVLPSIVSVDTMMMEPCRQTKKHMEITTG